MPFIQPAFIHDLYPRLLSPLDEESSGLPLILSKFNPEARLGYNSVDDGYLPVKASLAFGVLLQSQASHVVNSSLTNYAGSFAMFRGSQARNSST